MLRLLSVPGRFEPNRCAGRKAPAVTQPTRAARPPARGDELHAGREADVEFEFSAASLRDVRRLVAREADHCELSSIRRKDLVLAVDELATNSIAHGGGHGTLRVWRDRRAILCEVRDRGHISDPMVGMRQPTPEQLGGRGLWIVGRVCDRVQISSARGRTTVRVRMSAV
jgi:anti-sigma regulatory factor (Ser/Thr protein kinase)